ncbi:peptidase M23, partial [Escherichia coli]
MLNTRRSYRPLSGFTKIRGSGGNDSNLLIVFYVQIMPDD